MRRISVVGTSGSGKSTLRAALARQLGVAALELDAVHHLAGWHSRDRDSFRAEVRRFLARHDAWVVDGNYAQVRDLVLEAADTAVWLDLPRSTTMRRVVTRSVRRVVTREELWNGNREQWGDLLAWDPERSIIRWTWTTHGKRRAEYAEVLADPRWQPLHVHRLRTPPEVREFLAGVG